MLRSEVRSGWDGVTNDGTDKTGHVPLNGATGREDASQVWAAEYVGRPQKTVSTKPDLVEAAWCCGPEASHGSAHILHSSSFTVAPVKRKTDTLHRFVFNSRKSWYRKKKTFCSGFESLFVTNNPETLNLLCLFCNPQIDQSTGFFLDLWPVYFTELVQFQPCKVQFTPHRFTTILERSERGNFWVLVVNLDRLSSNQELQGGNLD